MFVFDFSWEMMLATQAPTSLPLSKSLKGLSGTEPVRSLGAGRLRIQKTWAKVETKALNLTDAFTDI